mgnify:CR=1 FL=1
MSFNSGDTDCFDIPAAKAELRKAIREARRALDQNERQVQAAAVAEHIAHLPQLSLMHGGVLLAYMPMRYELDILPAVLKLRGLGFEIAFPLCTEEHGLRLLIPPEDGFRKGAYGITEPVPELSREVAPEDLAAILLPAIGFDKSFARLGQGGGYYDRLLAKTSCLTVACGFDCQLVERVPTEPFDRKVDIIVTPSWVGEGSAE